MALFTIFNNHNKSKEKVFWTIEENENNPNQHLVKFYNRENELLHQEVLKGLKKDILDDTALQKIRKISKKALKRVA